jgi:hypothetical protein
VRAVWKRLRRADLPREQYAFAVRLLHGSLYVGAFLCHVHVLFFFLCGWAFTLVMGIPTSPGEGQSPWPQQDGACLGNYPLNTETAGQKACRKAGHQKRRARTEGQAIADYKGARQEGAEHTRQQAETQGGA